MKKNFHVIPVKDKDLFIPSKTATENLYNKEGISVTIGRLKENPEGSPVAQEFLFDKSKWDIENAQNWVKDNGGFLDDMLNKSQGEQTMQPITKIFDCELKDFNEKERTFKAIASTEVDDRDGDILRAAGWKLVNYKKNPVGLWGHNSTLPPIFKTIEIGIENNKLVFIPKFVPEEISPFAEQIFQLYKNKFLRAFSVRFLPFKWDEIPPKDDKPGTRRLYGRDYKSQDLLEISACTVPANPECLANKSYQDVIVKDNQLQNFEMISPEIKQKLMGEFKMDATVKPPQKKEVPEKKEGLININVQDIDKIKPLLDMIKSGRMLSSKNRKLIKGATEQLTLTVTALNELMQATEEQRSTDDIISDLKTDLENKDEEASPEDMEKLTKLIEQNQAVLNSLGKNGEE